MKTTPYIGITDFTDFKQVQKMHQVLWKHKIGKSQRRLHVGVMMSFKTLHSMETRWSKAFPPKETVAGIFDSNEAYNCLHYADYVNRSSLPQDLSTAIGYGGIGIDAVQLDMIWPDPGAVADGVHRSRKRIEVILQIGKDAIDAAHHNPDEVARRLEDYEEVIDRVLLDMSMGRGLAMNSAELLPYARAIKKRFPWLRLVVAGGLGPDTVGLIKPIAEEFPDISIDAQGKLRPSGDALDPIDWDMATKYLIQALKILE